MRLFFFTILSIANVCLADVAQAAPRAPRPKAPPPAAAPASDLGDAPVALLPLKGATLPAAVLPRLDLVLESEFAKLSAFGAARRDGLAVVEKGAIYFSKMDCTSSDVSCWCKIEDEACWFDVNEALVQERVVVGEVVAAGETYEAIFVYFEHLKGQAIKTKIVKGSFNPDTASHDFRRLLTELLLPDRFVGFLQIKAPAGTKAWLDGAAFAFQGDAPVALSVGPHRLQIGEGKQSVARDVQILFSETKVIEYRGQAAPAGNDDGSDESLILPMIAWGAGAALVGVAAVSMLAGGAVLGFAFASSGSPANPDDKVAELTGLSLISYGFGTVGVLLLVGGAAAITSGFFLGGVE